MDKWEKKLILKLVIGFNIVVILIQIVSNLLFEGNISLDLEFTKGFIYGEMLLVGLPIFIIMCIIFFIKKKNTQPFEKLNREINEEYTPAMASVLIDNNVESNKDILATILDLSVRDYLRIINNTEIVVNERNIDNLYLHEQYIINQIKKKHYIETTQFMKLVITDCKNKELIKNIGLSSKEGKMFTLNLYLSIIFLFIGMMIEEINYMLLLFIIPIVFVIIYSAFKKNYAVTKKGREIATEYRGFKEYIKNYTLVKKRDVKYINILDRYLTYAFALEEADNIEEKFMPYNKLIKKYILEI